MDTQGIQEIAINILFALIVIVLAVTLFRDVYKKRKMLKTARAEEDSMPELLEEELPEDKYVVLENQHIMTKLGKSRADFIIVSVYGLFFLEFRMFYKFIKADEMKQQWFRYLGLRRNAFTSPLWQAKIHAYSVKEVIGQEKDIPYFPMAVFPSFDKIDEAEFAPTSFVGTYEEFLNFIDEQKEEVLTIEEVQAIARLIQAYSDKVEEMDNITPPTTLPEEYRAFTDTKTFIDEADEKRQAKELAEAKQILGDDFDKDEDEEAEGKAKAEGKTEGEAESEADAEAKTEADSEAGDKAEAEKKAEAEGKETSDKA